MRSKSSLLTVGLRIWGDNILDAKLSMKLILDCVKSNPGNFFFFFSLTFLTKSWPLSVHSVQGVLRALREVHGVSLGQCWAGFCAHQGRKAGTAFLALKLQEMNEMRFPRVKRDVQYLESVSVYMYVCVWGAKGRGGLIIQKIMARDNHRSGTFKHTRTHKNLPLSLSRSQASRINLDFYKFPFPISSSFSFSFFKFFQFHLFVAKEFPLYIQIVAISPISHIWNLTCKVSLIHFNFSPVKKWTKIHREIINWRPSTWHLKQVMFLFWFRRTEPYDLTHY